MPWKIFQLIEAWRCTTVTWNTIDDIYFEICYHCIYSGWKLDIDIYWNIFTIFTKVPLSAFVRSLNFVWEGQFFWNLIILLMIYFYFYQFRSYVWHHFDKLFGVGKTILAHVYFYPQIFHCTAIPLVVLFHSWQTRESLATLFDNSDCYQVNCNLQCCNFLFFRTSLQGHTSFHLSQNS